MRHSYVYVIINLVTSKEYVGQSIRPNFRWKSHFHSARNGGELALHRAIRKYGEHNFAVSIIRKCTEGDVNHWEEYYIEKFDTMIPSGYNMTYGGDGVYGSKFSPESKNRCSNSAKNRWSKEEERSKLSAAVKLRCEDPAYRKKLSEAHRTRFSSPEARRIASAAAKLRFKRPEERVKVSLAAKRMWENLNSDPVARKFYVEKLSIATKKQWTRQKQVIQGARTLTHNDYGKK